MEWIDRFVEMLFPLDGKSRDIEGAYMLKHKHMPDSLFKYRAVNEASKKKP